MKLTQEQLDFEKRFEPLIGLKLSKAEYLEINYGSDYPSPFYQTRFKDIDSVDFSVILHFEDGYKAEFFWDGQFFQYGVGLKLNSESVFSGYRKWDVSENELWKKFIGDSMKEIEINWEWVTTTEEKTGKVEKFDYPQDVKLSFSSNKNIFISAAAFMEEDDEKVYGLMDNLLVTDNEQLARQVNMIS